MRGVNKVIIVGNLGADPESRTFDNGGTVTNVSVATTEAWNDKQTGERKEITEWHRVTFNGRLAEVAVQYLRKGSSVYIEGKLRTRKYTDNSGQERYITEVRADIMQMLGGGAGENQHGDGSNTYQKNYDNQQPQQGFSNQQQQSQNPQGAAMQQQPIDESIPF